MTRTIGLFLVAAAGTAHASPPETNLEDMKEICGYLATLAPHLRERHTRTEIAEDAAFLEEQFDFPVALADLQLHEHGPDVTTIDRRLFRSGEELAESEMAANFIPPSSFLAACDKARRSDELRVGEIEPTPWGGKLDRHRGAVAVVSDGSTASVTWHHDGFGYFFMVTLKRDPGGRWKITGSRGWPCSLPL
jgi:hypothetical protein